MKYQYLSLFLMGALLAGGCDNGTNPSGQDEQSLRELLARKDYDLLKQQGYKLVPDSSVIDYEDIENDKSIFVKALRQDNVCLARMCAEDAKLDLQFKLRETPDEQTGISSDVVAHLIRIDATQVLRWLFTSQNTLDDAVMYDIWKWTMRHNTTPPCSFLESLLEYGLSPEKCLNDINQNLLHEVCRELYTNNEHSDDMIAFLIEHGVRVNHQDNNGDTPLHIVAHQTRFRSSYLEYYREELTRTINALLEGEADLTLRNNDGELATDLVVESLKHLFDPK